MKSSRGRMGDANIDPRQDTFEILFQAWELFRGF